MPQPAQVVDAAGGRLLQQGRGGVGAAVVHDQDFVGPLRPGQGGAPRREELVELVRGVVGRDHDGDAGAGGGRLGHGAAVRGAAGGGRRHIVNLNHGVDRSTPVANFEAFVRAAQGR